MFEHTTMFKRAILNAGHYRSSISKHSSCRMLPVLGDLIQINHHQLRGHKHQTHTIRTLIWDKPRIQEYVSILTNEERKEFFQAIEECKAEDEAEIVPKEIKTNEQEPIPDDEAHRVPTRIELRQVSIHQALPFIGFGFLDNFIMIIAGDFLELTLGVTLGISTMAAAGLGNALSDIAGIGSAFYVERLCERVGLPVPSLSVAQMKMRCTRWTIQLARAIGITIGCLLGMCPLFFLPHKGTNKDGAKEAGDDDSTKIKL